MDVFRLSMAMDQHNQAVALQKYCRLQFWHAEIWYQTPNHFFLFCRSCRYESIMVCLSMVAESSYTPHMLLLQQIKGLNKWECQNRIRYPGRKSMQMKQMNKDSAQSSFMDWHCRLQHEPFLFKTLLDMKRSELVWCNFGEDQIPNPRW